MKKLGEINMIKKNVIISMLLLLFACQSNETSGRITFEELYDGDLANVSRIQIRSSNGELKSVIVKQEIGEWLESVQVLEFKREENLEGNHNPLYTVKLFEGDVVRLKFSPERIGDVYYEQNDTLIEKTEDLFDNQAIRKH